jgi:hypothetical protein
MQPDLVFSVLAVLLGAMISYAVDEHLQLSLRFNAWLDRVLEH